MKLNRFSKSADRSAGIVLAVLSVLAMLLAPTVAVAQSGYRVIVHPDNPTASLSRSEVSKIFLKRQLKWDDGLLAVPVDQAVDAQVRDSFSKEIHKRGASMIRSFWQQQIYSGRAVPPAERGSDSEVIDFVAANRGAIGYVSPGASTSSVKVIQITD